MTRYAFPQKLTVNSTDVDGTGLTLSHIGISDPPNLINWVTTNPVILNVLSVGTVEIYQDGTAIYDDHGDIALHPTTGATTTLVRVYFKVFDGTDQSASSSYFDLTMTGIAAGDTTAPTFALLNPAVSSSNIAVSITPIIKFSEAVQQGSGSLTVHNATDNTDIETFTLPGAIGTGPGKIAISDTDVTVDPTAELPNNKLISFRWTAGFVKDLAGNNVAAKTDDSVSFTTIAAPSGLAFPDDSSPLVVTPFRGRAANVSYDPTGALLVDATGAGGAYTTITAAMAAAVAGDKIAVKDTGVYAESFTLKSGVTIQGWNTDKPRVSAQQAVTGFTQCTSADASVLGSVLGVTNSPVYKKTGILKSSVPVTDLLGIAPMEDWVPLFNAQDRANQTAIDFQEDESRFYDLVAHGGSYTLSSGKIVGLTDTTIINASRYTNTQLTNTKVRYYVAPNETAIAQITAADVVAGTITFGGGKTPDNTPKRRFAIQNIGFAMVSGTFFFVDQGSTFDLYIYPYNPANMSKITIVARKTIITLATTGTDMAIKGLRLVGPSGEGTGEGTAITEAVNGSASSNIIIENCEFVGSTNTAQLHYAAIWLIRANNILIQNNSFKYCAAHGVFPNGSLVNEDVCTIRRNAFIRCGSAPAKAYKQNKYAFVANYVEWCGYRSHGNLGNVYLGGIHALWWANEFQFCQGYLTCQSMQNPNYCFNWLPCDNKYTTSSVDRSCRKIENQGASGICYLFNNSAPPTFVGSAQQGQMALDGSDGGMTVYYANNVAHGIPIPADQAGTVGYAKNNLVTSSNYSGSIGDNLDATDFDGSTGKFDTTNVFNTNLAAIYTDYLNRDWSPVNSSSPIKTMTTYDITSVINSYFIPTFTGGVYGVPIGDFYLDFLGNAINFAGLKMGADQSI